MQQSIKRYGSPDLKNREQSDLKNMKESKSMKINFSFITLEYFKIKKGLILNKKIYFLAVWSSLRAFL